MANIKNLQDQEVEKLKEILGEMKQDNPDLDYKFFRQDEKSQPMPDAESRIAALESKIDTLTRKINMIFGSNVLIDGKFIEVKR